LPPLCEVTCKFTEPDVALPGFGFVTLTAKFPVDDSLPVAVSCVDETKVVASGEPASCACAPLAKPLPLSVNEKLPVETEVGATLASTGIGFHSVTTLLPKELESAALTACTVTVFEFGTLAGAV
jgi:hypothetical protein